MRAPIRTTWGLLLLGVAAACSRGPVTTSFVATLGARDTVAVETYTRSGDRLEGTSVAAYPRATTRSYEVSFGPDGEVQHVHLTSGPPGAEPVSVADFTYSGDSVTVEIRRDTTTQRFAVATAGWRPLPFSEDLFAFWGISLAQAMEGGADSTTIDALAGRTVLPIDFERRSPSSADFGFPEWGTVRASFADGRLDTLDMTATTSKYLVTRVPAVDVQRTAEAWASRPQPGALSPRDTASADVGAAHVVIDYGRPSMRGRKVFGGIVPWGEVWRLGANAATQLTTDRDLVIGGTPVPAGTYSLWAVPTATAWTLVVNEQHGQWGTQYDATRDLARIPMTVTTLPEPVEQFTIAVNDDGSGTGSIEMEWESTRGTVSFTTR
jgi:hypothetical protein